VTLKYLLNEDLALPEGFTDWPAYWRAKGPTPLGAENARIFLEERGCRRSRSGRYRLGHRKFESVDPEIRNAVDFLVSVEAARGWTTLIEEDIPENERRMPLKPVKPRKSLSKPVPILSKKPLRAKKIGFRPLKQTRFSGCED
jgi:hypothetical protein